MLFLGCEALVLVLLCGLELLVHYLEPLVLVLLRGLELLVDSLKAFFLPFVCGSKPLVDCFEALFLELLQKLGAFRLLLLRGEDLFLQRFHARLELAYIGRDHILEKLLRGLEDVFSHHTSENSSPSYKSACTKVPPQNRAHPPLTTAFPSASKTATARSARSRQ